MESYSLFGYDMDRYDELFEEHLELFLKLNREAVVSWNGQFRPALKNAEIAPRPIQPEIPFWVGVGGSPESAARAGRYGVPMALAILGGELGRFQPLVEIYHQAGLAAGHAPEQLKTGVTGHVYLANTTEQAKDEYYSYYSNYWYIVNRQRGMGLKLSREEFDTMARPETALFVGSPEQVIEKVLRQYELFGHRRFMAQLDIGGLPFKKVAEGIELLAAKVAPVLRRETRLSR